MLIKAMGVCNTVCQVDTCTVNWNSAIVDACISNTTIEWTSRNRDWTVRSDRTQLLTHLLTLFQAHLSSYCRVRFFFRNAILKIISPIPCVSHGMTDHNVKPTIPSREIQWRASPSKVFVQSSQRIRPTVEIWGKLVTSLSSIRAYELHVHDTNPRRDNVCKTMTGYS